MRCRITGNAAEPQKLSVMGLLIGQAEQLPAPLEPALEKLIGEEQVAADPATALTIWGPLSQRLPKWDYARLKAADLSPQLKALNRCTEHLEAATEQRQLTTATSKLGWPWHVKIPGKHCAAGTRGSGLRALAVMKRWRNYSGSGSEKRNGRPKNNRQADVQRRR